MDTVPPSDRPGTCPTWCTLTHGRHRGEDDTVHVSGSLVVRHTVLRLCMTVDPGTGAQEGPFVLVGAEELTLHEAEALIDALTQLVDRGAEVSPPAGA
ncbi:DUF6907 domain-containing protein [Nocardioides xinjiangensis]|uniref:DUF6907 domain-containing protein n=1 Tax=Nocardioides xinjiangensis TaxID=2817376 RepID=UPI001B304001|nr:MULTISPECIES: hypothetical protein [unclassified Nocardioides]